MKPLETSFSRSLGQGLETIDIKVGYSRDSIGDWLLGHHPDFKIFKGHKGGTGDTFELVSYKDGIYLLFAHEKLRQIVVANNWKGEIKGTGIKLGDSLEEFLSTFSYERKGKTSHSGRGDEAYLTSSYGTGGYGAFSIFSIYLIADFNRRKKIKRIRIQMYDNSPGIWSDPLIYRRHLRPF